MPHLPLTKEYSQCAFTQKNHKLARMLLSKGHEVFVYGVGYTDIEHQNFKYFDVVSMDDVKGRLGVMAIIGLSLDMTTPTVGSGMI